MSTGTTIGRMLGLPAIAWLGLLASANPCMAQAPAAAARFQVEWWGEGGSSTYGVMTVSAETIRFDANGDDSSGFEFPLEEILHVKQASRLLTMGITPDLLEIKLRKRKGGYSNRNYNFYVRKDDGSGRTRVTPVIQAITAAMKVQQATGGRPAMPASEEQTPPPPKPKFAAIPAPQAPVGAPTAPATVIAGQTPDQVKANLGPPDRIDPRSSPSQVSKQIVWFYKGLTVTFVDGKVSSVQQVRP